jgi:triosephosphate isomerase (TIM)
MSERKLIFAANWKMNHGPAEARAFARQFLSLTVPTEGRRLWFFPSAVSIGALAEAMQSRSDITVGAQNVHWEPKGPFTGGISIPMVKEVGARLILVGHSERRHLFGETDEQVARKTKAALSAGLTPLVCVGETLAERDGGRTEQVIVRQLGSVLQALDPSDWSRLVLAYEPVWAIGTGETATPEDAQDAIGQIRGLLGELGGEDFSTQVRIIYGGSIKPDNIGEIMAQNDVDGGLVGGASLEADSFVELVNGAAKGKDG